MIHETTKQSVVRPKLTANHQRVETVERMLDGGPPQQGPHTSAVTCGGFQVFTYIAEERIRANAVQRTWGMALHNDTF
jgi:hypothetical protein